MDARPPAEADLPTWNLADLYAGMDDPVLVADLDRALADAQAFETTHKGRLAAQSGAEFGAAIETFERIGAVLSKALSYAQLVQAEDMADSKRGRYAQTVQERVTDISVHTLFFPLEINRLEDTALEAKLADPRAARYRPWLRDIRVFRPHQLADDLEKLMHEKEVAGRSAWIRLYDETLARLRVRLDGKNQTLTQALDRLSDPDRKKRRAAGRALGKSLNTQLPVLALITNTLAKDKAIEDDWRQFPHPLRARNLANQVEDEVVEALVQAVKGAYGPLSHRYYGLKAGWLGLPKLAYTDRNAPLPQDSNRRYGWAEAKAIVEGAYAGFDPEIGRLARRFFDRPWIDAGPRPGKASGAFAHPTVPSAHPYLLLNYMGKARDVMTLAHEMGHGVHQLLAAKQGPLLSETPLTLAETASVFGEMLVFRAMLDSETDPVHRRVLLAGKVEDMLNTVVRQVAFHEFERQVHGERRQGELTPTRIAEIWMAVQRESLGPAFRLGADYHSFWAYIPHFVHSPFYVYAYAFGDCLVNSLYAVYQKSGADFLPRYRAMLAAGGTLRHAELLAPFGLDASDPGFWRRGLELVIGFIDELERLE
ncbi:MAG: M3 family oligoendopeptidase [Rhodospirillales bacterium]|nr:M3 family oligoendopeptidase [Rhodospirillales bacterium]